MSELTCLCFLTTFKYDIKLIKLNKPFKFNFTLVVKNQVIIYYKLKQ